MANYLEGLLEPGDKRRFEAHLANCDFCVALVGSIVRQQEAPEQVEVPAPLLRQALDAVPAKRSPGLHRRWVLAPALVAIVVASAVLLKSPEPAKFTPPDVPAPAVEKTRPAAPVSQAQSQPAGKPEVRSLKPPAPGLQLVEPRSGSIVRGEGLRFRWRGVANAAYYEIRMVNSEGDLVWQGQSTDSVTQVPAALSLPPGKYFVWIRAYLSDGRTLKSETIDFRIGGSS